MFCSKCGRETQDQQMFCQSCSEAMLSYPVDSDTPIQLPLRNETVAVKRRAPKKKPLSPEEALSRTRGALRLFVLLSAILLIAFVLAAALALHLLDARDAVSLLEPFSFVPRETFLFLS